MPAQKKVAAKRKSVVKPKLMLTARIRPVGNSKGVILNNDLLKAAGLDANAEITLEASDGVITIAQTKPSVNTDLKSWDKHFKKAIKAGAKPEKDLFEGLTNEFDNREW